MAMKKLSSLFAVRYGHSLSLTSLKLAKPSDGVPFISRKMGDNGVAAYVEPIEKLDPAPAGDLTCALSGSGVLSTFAQDQPYYTAYHVACLTPLQPLTTAQKLYYCLCIGANRYRYGWGRQANRSVKDIMLPELDEFPAWVEDRAAMVDLRGKDAPLHARGPDLGQPRKRKPFLLTAVFTI